MKFYLPLLSLPLHRGLNEMILIHLYSECTREAPLPMLVANWWETGSFLLCVRCFFALPPHQVFHYRSAEPSN